MALSPNVPLTDAEKDAVVKRAGPHRSVHFFLERLGGSRGKFRTVAAAIHTNQKEGPQ